MLGALLMAIGHVVLGASEIHPLSFLYLSLAIIVCGYGLFKSNVSCLLGELYEPTDPRRDGGFSLMYAAGNVGSIIAPIAWWLRPGRVQLGDGLWPGGGGYDRGLVILCGNRHFTHTRWLNKKVLRATNFLLPEFWGWLLVLLVATPALITVLFWKEWSDTP